MLTNYNLNTTLYSLHMVIHQLAAVPTVRVEGVSGGGGDGVLNFQYPFHTFLC